MRKGSKQPDHEFSDGVVCFAGTDWWYHPRGHSECQIMRRLARRTTVLWVNSIGMRAPKPGVARNPLGRYWRKLKSTLRGLRRDAGGMWVYSPVFIPRYSPRFVRINGWLVRAQVRMLCRLLGIKRPSAWVTVPTAAHAALGSAFHRRVFNRCDDFAKFPQADAVTISALEHKLLVGCDATVFVSRTLFERERDLSPHPVLLGHGLDYDHFARDHDDPAFATNNNPLDGIRTPIIGFYGGIEDYTVDLDLLRSTARRFPDATLVVAGPRSVGTTALEAEPNVRVLGPIPYDQLPSIASRFDVGVMPWRENDWIRACNPIKLKEYLALGFPIVSTPFPALGPFLDHVRVGGSPDEFADAIRSALRDSCQRARARRRAAVRGESWDAKAERVAHLLTLPPNASARRQVEYKRRALSPEPHAASMPTSAADQSPRVTSS
ncbi:MAG: glycosyltransferase [Phycisphaerales bacterium]